MEIETYEIEDVTSEGSAMANDAAALELIEKLGLTGQQSIMNGSTVTRVPYRAMEAAEMAVYSALCDRRIRLENYSADPIPVRVLQVAAHAKETEMFGRIEVWYPSEARIDDPILVGVRIEYPYKNDQNPSYRTLTSEKFHMLARWGKTLLPFEKLQAMAVKKFKTVRQSALAKAISEAKAAMEALPETEDITILSKGVSFDC